MSMNMFELFLTQIVKEFNLDKTKLDEMWNLVMNQKCDYVVKKGTADEYVCGKHVKMDGKCYRHLPTDKVMKDPSKCCGHIVKKKNGDEEQCNRLAKKNGLCNKHSKSKEQNKVEVTMCSHIVKKKDGTEEQCNRKVVDDTDVCKKHTKKNVNTSVSTNDDEAIVLKEVQEPVEFQQSVEESVEESVEKQLIPVFKPTTPIAICQFEKCKNKVEEGEKKCSKHLKVSTKKPIKKPKTIEKNMDIVNLTVKDVEENYDNLF